MAEYLTVMQACGIAGISRSTFYKLLADPDSRLGEVAIRIPGLARVRVPERAFREWLESAPASDATPPGGVRHRGRTRQRLRPGPQAARERERRTSATGADAGMAADRAGK